MPNCTGIVRINEMRSLSKRPGMMARAPKLMAGNIGRIMLMKKTGIAKESEVLRARYQLWISFVLARDSSWALLLSLSASRALYPAASIADTIALRPMREG